MANNRKSLGKGLRFDVFKRDGFTCQYCGQRPPDVVLQVDHIYPVAEGGDNDILNLVTSCEACNQGKKAKRLDVPVRPDADIAWLEMQQELAELRRYQAAKQERDRLIEEVVESLQMTWIDSTGLEWAPSVSIIRQMMNAYSPDLVEQAFLIVAPKAASGYVGTNKWVQYTYGTLRRLAATSQDTE